MWQKLTPSEHQGFNGKLFLLWYQNNSNCQLVISQDMSNYRLQFLETSCKDSLSFFFLVCHPAGPLESFSSFVLFALLSSRASFRCVCVINDVNISGVDKLACSISWLPIQQCLPLSHWQSPDLISKSKFFSMSKSEPWFFFIFVRYPDGLKQVIVVSFSLSGINSHVDFWPSVIYGV